MSTSIVGYWQMLNPVFTREFRARWRRPLTYCILVGYGLFLAWLVWQIYLTRRAVAGIGSPSAVMVDYYSGHGLFEQVMGLQIVLWTMLAPLLTAPAIASEIERDMLSELLFTPLTSRGIVREKFYSCLIFAAALISVALPVDVICCSLGQVAFSTLACALLQQFAVVVAGAAVGMVCSILKRNTVAALGIALAAGAIDEILLCFLANLVPHFQPIGVLVALTLSLGLAILCLSIAEEVVTTATVEDDSTAKHWSPDSMAEPIVITAPGVLRPDASSAANFVMVQSFLKSREILDEQAALKVDNHLVHQYEQVDGQVGAAITHEPLEVSDAESPVFSHQATRTSFGWMTRWIEWSPLLQREWRVRGREDMGATAEAASGQSSRMGIGLIIGAGIVMMTLNLPLSFWWILMVLSSCLACIYSTLTASSVFVREREQDTLSMLLLTRLSTRDIVLGNYSIALSLAAYYFAPLLAVLFLWALSFGLGVAIGGLVFALSAVYCAAACGLFFSWMCRHTATAFTGAIVAFLSIILTTPPYLVQGQSRVVNGISWLFSGPRWTINMGGPITLNFPLAVLIQACYFIAIGSVLLWFVERSLRPAAVERQSRSFLHTDLSRNLR